MKLIFEDVTDCVFYYSPRLAFVGNKWSYEPKKPEKPRLDLVLRLPDEYESRYSVSEAIEKDYQKRLHKWHSIPRKSFYLCEAGRYGFKIYPSQKRDDELKIKDLCNYYQCGKAIDGKCVFFDTLNNIVTEIEKSINVHTRKLKDSDFLPYYYLHEFIKNYPVEWYDAVISKIVEYLKPPDDSDIALQNSTGIGYPFPHSPLLRKVKGRIRKAVVMMCMIRTECAYKPLVKGIERTIDER